MKLLPASFTSSNRKMLVASVALMSIGLGSTAASGAWFTDQQSITSNNLTAATVKLAPLGDNNSTTPLKFTNVIPVADADVASKASTYNLNIANQGTTTVNWNLKLIPNTAASSSTDIGNQIMVSYSRDSGKTWSDATAANSLGTITGTNLPAGTPQVIQFRAWLPSTTGNSAQGQTYVFDLQANAIQANAGSPS